MIKFKYQGGLTKLITSEIGKKNKIDFSSYINKNLISLRHNFNTGLIKMSVVSFSSFNDFYEQVLSILSFLRYVGTPISWIVYSDGTHTSEQIQLLTSGFEFIEVKKTNLEKEETSIRNYKKELLPYIDELLHYAKKEPLGKKLFFYLNHQVKTPTLFLDSDILFYNMASIFNLLLDDEINGWYLPDTDWGCLDSRYKAKNYKQLYQVNSGFFLLNKELADLNDGLEFLKNLHFEYEYFSEQNIFHIIFRCNHLMPLDPRFFILNNEDQFDFSYLCAKEKMAIRHYTGPVRHKMWQRDWRWHLSIPGIK